MKFPCSKAKGREDQSLALLLKSIPIKTEFIHLALFEIWKLFQMGGEGGFDHKKTHQIPRGVLQYSNNPFPFPFISL